MELIIGGAQLTIQLITVLIAIDLWRSSRRRHALIAIFALSVMFLRRITALLIQLEVSIDPIIKNIDTLALPFLISLLWFWSVITSKKRVDHGSRT